MPAKSNGLAGAGEAAKRNLLTSSVTLPNPDCPPPSTRPPADAGAADLFDPAADAWRGTLKAYAAIRERVAAGGPGWNPSSKSDAEGGS